MTILLLILPAGVIHESPLFTILAQYLFIRI